MKRRSFLAAASLAPAIARAQGHARSVGVLMGYGQADAGAGDDAAGLMQGLAALGWNEGGNIHVEWRWAAGDPALFERHAADLLTLKPDVLVAQGTPSIKALRPKAGAIPIVFTIVTDPVGQGFVESLAHPGGTVTGFTDFDPSMASKWLQMLTETRPTVSRVVVLYNPGTAPFAGTMLRAIEQTALAFGVTAQAAACHDAGAVEAALADAARAAGGGVIALPDLFNLVNRGAIIASAARHRLPAVYFNRTFTLAGGLMSYGVDYTDQFRRAAGYVDRLLKGAQAADLPVQQPDKFDLSINLKTAKALGIEIPPATLAIAADVIE
jgi:putative ABC transport system substrate-binding protein